MTSQPLLKTTVSFTLGGVEESRVEYDSIPPGCGRILNPDVKGSHEIVVRFECNEWPYELRAGNIGPRGEERMICIQKDGSEALIGFGGINDVAQCKVIR
jgi:hypothetical protein